MTIRSSGGRASCSPCATSSSGAWNEPPELVADEHGKVVSDDELPALYRGLEVVEYACGIPTLFKGEYSEQVSTDVDAYSGGP